MSNRLLVIGFVVVLLGLTVLAAFLQQREAASGSSLSSRGGGWLLARRYAEEMGTETRLLDSASARPDPDELAFAVFPWQVFDSMRRDAPLVDHVRRGGTLVIAYSGREEDMGEQALMEAFGLSQRESASPPLRPLEWYSYARSSIRLAPTPDFAALGALHVRPMERIPWIPESASVWYRNQEGYPVVATLAHGSGRLILLPAEALSNGRLEDGAHASLLATLVDRPESRWSFDEFHHGLAAPDAPESRQSRHAVDLWLVHLLLVYALGVLALVRRLGPAWTLPPLTTGSTRSFFLGIGRLAAGLGGHHDAARLLVARAKEWNPALQLAEDLPVATDAPSFVRFARTVAEAQKRRH